MPDNCRAPPCSCVDHVKSICVLCPMQAVQTEPPQNEDTNVDTTSAPVSSASNHASGHLASLRTLHTAGSCTYTATQTHEQMQTLCTETSSNAYPCGVRALSPCRLFAPSWISSRSLQQTNPSQMTDPQTTSPRRVHSANCSLFTWTRQRPRAWAWMTKGARYIQTVTHITSDTWTR